jgi:hypothetical protein
VTEIIPAQLFFTQGFYDQCSHDFLSHLPFGNLGR